MNDPKRQEIKDRIAASQARNEGRTPSSATGNGSEDSGIIGFIKEHPITTIAGALAVGVLVAGMFPSARHAAKKGGARASALGVLGTQAALSAFQHLLDSTEDARHSGAAKLDDLGDVIGDAARNLRREARDTGKTAARSLNDWWR